MKKYGESEPPATCLLNTHIPLSSLSSLYPIPTQGTKQKFLSPRE